MSTSSPTADPAYIKLELLRTGVKVSSRSEFETAPFLDLIFSKGVWASLAEEDINNPAACYELIREQEFFYLVGPNARIHVEVRRNPDFYTSRTTSGAPFGEVATIRANYIEILPRAIDPASRFPPNDIREVVERSLAGGWAEYVSFCDLSRPGEDALQNALPYIKAIRQYLDTHISLATLLPTNRRVAEDAYGCGVDSVAYYRAHESMEKTKDLLNYAVGVFSKGGVSLALLLDEEEKQHIPEYIDALVGIGVFPMLCYRKPFEKCIAHPLDAAASIKMFRRVALALRRAKFNTGWVPHASAVIRSLDPAYFLPVADRSLVRTMMRTVAGSRLAFGVAALRRKLHVREKAGS